MSGSASGAVTIRTAREHEHAAIARIAELDSAQPPAGRLLVAVLDGELLAAISLADGAIVANPFRSTIEVVELLAARERQLRGTSMRRRTLAAASLRALRALAAGF
jgi:hypothetical protein